MQQFQGLDKDDIVKLITDGTITDLKQAKTAIASMKIDRNIKYNSVVKVGDIYKCVTLSNHPCVVVSVKKDLVYSILMTSEAKTKGILKKCNSRFLKENYLTSTLVVCSKQNVLDNFYAVYDNAAEIKESKLLIKELYKNI